jgi:hypothetical protein
MKVKFPANPIKGQLYTFIDYNNYCPSKGYFCSTHVYTGSKWVKMKSQEFAPKDKVQATTNRIKPIR